MPPLRKPAETREFPLPPRTGRLAAETDVLVVGSGPAGLGAAIGAADAGARVVLAERYGFLGGMATAALVMPLASYFSSDLAATRAGAAGLVPTDSTHGRPVIGGVLQQLIDRLVAIGGAIAPSELTGYVTPFDAEAFKNVAMDAINDAGVEVLLHAFASQVLVEDGRIEGVVFETKSGPVVVNASCVVDCTGDGDIAAAAGAPYEVGRAEDGLTQPMTLYFQLLEFDRAAWEAYVETHAGQWFGVFGLWDLIREAHEKHDFSPPREDILMFATPFGDEVAMNSTRVTEVLGTDVFDLTRAEWEGHGQAREIARFMRDHVPGFERSRMKQSGTQVGVRETRRILGEYQLTQDDVLQARKHDDAVAQNAYPMDIHNPRGRGTMLRRVPPGEAYDVPLRCLIPRDVDGLLVAGRCLSATHEALSSVRVMPSCVATGQGAGVAAALAVIGNTVPRRVAAKAVQAQLLTQGAALLTVPV